MLCLNDLLKQQVTTEQVHCYLVNKQELFDTRSNQVLQYIVFINSKLHQLILLGTSHNCPNYQNRQNMRNVRPFDLLTRRLKENNIHISKAHLSHDHKSSLQNIKLPSFSASFLFQKLFSMNRTYKCCKRHKSYIANKCFQKVSIYEQDRFHPQRQPNVTK